MQHVDQEKTRLLDIFPGSCQCCEISL